MPVNNSMPAGHDLRLEAQALRRDHLGCLVTQAHAQPSMLLQALDGHQEAVLALAVGDSFLVSGSYDTTVRFWSLDGLRCIRCTTESPLAYSPRSGWEDAACAVPALQASVQVVAESCIHKVWWQIWGQPCTSIFGNACTATCSPSLCGGSGSQSAGSALKKWSNGR